MLKYQTKIEKSAKNADAALEAALEELKLTKDEVDIEIEDEGTKGFLGLGSKDAKVIVTVKEPAVYKAKAFLSKLFEAMNMEVSISCKLSDDSLLVELSGDKMGLVIGKRGDTLDSLQYLTSLVVNKDSENYLRVTVDTENYRQKRYDTLIALSDRLASKVAKSGRKYTLEPMNPYERRIIHSNLQANEDVTTFSIGEDPYRKVVIAPKNPVKNTYNSRSTSYEKPEIKEETKKEAPVVDEYDDDEFTTSFASYLPRKTKHENFESYMQERTQHNEEE